MCEILSYGVGYVTEEEEALIQTLMPICLYKDTAWRQKL